MKRVILASLIFAAILILWNCNDKSVNNDAEAAAVFKQGKCGETFLKSSAATLDSVFSYSFQNSLVIDFSLWANCCPHSYHFSITHMFAGDTLHIVATDTTTGPRCRCICPYFIRAEFSDLSKDLYFVICENAEGYIYHEAIVFRKP